MRRAAFALLGILAGCASRLPLPERLPVVVGDSCRIRTWSLSATGLPLPRTPLTLQSEQESDHLAGSVLGDWGRVLAGFLMDGNRVEGEHGWFTGVGMSPSELSAHSFALPDPERYAASLGEGWKMVGPDSCRSLFRNGRERLRWTRPEPDLHVLQDSIGGWKVSARLAQEEVQPAGSCRGH